MKRFTDFREGKSALSVTEKRGQAMGVCATFNEQYVCCRVHVLRSVQNCPFQCTYCFLQNYLTEGAMKSVADISGLMREVRERLQEEPHRLFRVGTWELGDSLALEEQTGQARKLVEEFSRLDNALLELKTKSSCVEPLLQADHRGRTVVSWSLNTSSIINTEEHATASLEERLHAMGKTAGAGYLMGLHFDPMILHDNWEEAYRNLVRLVAATVPREQIAWISMGSLRFNREMKRKMETNYPESKLTTAEMVTGQDGKSRYLKPMRVRMYQVLVQELRRRISSNPIYYLCMEGQDVWDRVLGRVPESPAHLDYIFATSLHKRFDLGKKRPERVYYEESLREKASFPPRKRPP